MLYGFYDNFLYILMQLVSWKTPLNVTNKQPHKCNLLRYSLTGTDLIDKSPSKTNKALPKCTFLAAPFISLGNVIIPLYRWSCTFSVLLL